MSETKRVLRAPEAATYTGLSESTLAKRRLYGLPPQYLCLGGRAIGYAIDDLECLAGIVQAQVHLSGRVMDARATVQCRLIAKPPSRQGRQRDSWYLYDVTFGGKGHRCRQRGSRNGSCARLDGSGNNRGCRDFR